MLPDTLEAAVSLSHSFTDHIHIFCALKTSKLTFPRLMLVRLACPLQKEKKFAGIKGAVARSLILGFSEDQSGNTPIKD